MSNGYIRALFTRFHSPLQLLYMLFDAFRFSDIAMLLDYTYVRFLYPFCSELVPFAIPPSSNGYQEAHYALDRLGCL